MTAEVSRLPGRNEAPMSRARRLRDEARDAGRDRAIERVPGFDGEVTQAFLRARYSYDPETGVLSWRIRGSLRIRRGHSVGHLRPDGYLMTQVGRRRLLVHRVIWLYVHGRWPSGELDHRDRCRSNNRLSNLREASSAQNRANCPRPNTSGFRGVGFQPKTPRRPWRAQIHVSGKCLYLGSFVSAEEAARAYDNAATAHQGAFALLNFPLGASA